MRRFLLPLVAALAGLAVAGAGATTGVLDGLESEAVDARYALRGAEAPRDIVVVGIDDDSIDELGRWPFSRRWHARAVDRLHKAKARLIVYDVQFTEQSPDLDADFALFDAIGRAGGAVLAASTSNDKGETKVLGGEKNLRAIRSRAGAANLPSEKGGVIRRYERATGKLPALAVVAAKRLGKRPSFPGDDRAWIDFRGGPKTFPTISFADLVKKRVDPTRLRGKIVVIGASSPTLQDTHPTPMSASALMSGPEIQANALWTAMHDNPLRDASGRVGLLAALVLALLAPLAMLRRRFLLTIATMLVLGGAYAAGAHALFLDGWVVPVVAPLVALLASGITALVGGGLMEARERRRVSRSNQLLQVELRDAHLEIVRRLAIAAESHDDQTGGHIERISRLTHRLSLAAGLNEHEAEMIRHASLMHDVGKIATPDAVLRKPGKLTEDEWEVMRAHTLEGARILSGSRSRLVQMAETIAMTHHERWDGSGYPNGLAGEDIPVEGRITAVCDVFDALVSKRTYKHAWTLADTLAEIRAQSGRQFDPHLVEIFLTIVGDLPPDLLGEGDDAASPAFVADLQAPVPTPDPQRAPAARV